MSETKRVFISDKFTDDALAILARCPVLEVDYRPGLELAEKIEAASRADALVIRSATKVTREFLENMGDGAPLELIVRAGVGVDNVDVDEATRRGIVVQNVPGGNTRSAAEHSVALLLAMARQIPVAHQSMRDGKWERSKFVGVEVLGKKLGVVGLGKIGRYVVEMATGLGFEILAYDPFVSPSMAEQLGVELIESVAELATKVDFLTVHVPLSEETKGLVGDEVLSGAKPGLRIINCARGGIVDEAALLRALEGGQVAAAAIDVFVEEPPGATELVRHPNVVVTPHLGASTREAQQNVALAASEMVVDFLTERRLHSPVNAIQLDPDIRDEVQPYRELALRLGRIQAQLLESNPVQIDVKYFGKLFSGKIQSYLTNSVLEGFVAGRSAQPVNFINVRALAQEQGLAISESSSGESRYFANLISVAVKDHEGRGHEVRGAIRGRSGLRLVSFDSYQFDAVFEGALLLVCNEDRPGMIGVVGTKLAGYDINVSNMSLGRDRSGGRALSVLSLDTPPPAAAVDELAAAEGIVWARAVAVD